MKTHLNKASKSRIRALILVLTLALTFSTFFLSGCSFLDFAKKNQEIKDEDLYIAPENGSYLNETEMVRTMILAMQNTDKLQSIWQHIPSQQRQEITLSDFVDFLRIMKHVLPDEIVSFQKLTADELNTIRISVSRAIPALADEAEKSSFWQIISQDSSNQQSKFVIGINKNDDGIPCFSASWLEHQTFLYDYIHLYFNALETKNSAALYQLLHQQGVDNPASYDLAVQSRVNGILSFYDDFSTTQLRSFHINDLLPGNASAVQHNLPGGQPSRVVNFRESNGIISVSEKIPQTLKAGDAHVTVNESLSFELESKENRLNSESSLPQLGIPLDIKILQNKDDPNTSVARQGKNVDFRVSWPGIQVDAFGSFDLDTISFDGIIRRIDLYYSDYNIGSGLTIGDSNYRLYIDYPFARENDFLISGEINNVMITLAIQLESDHIARLTIVSDNAETLQG